MKIRLALSIAILIGTISCKHSGKTEKPTQEVPKALQNNDKAIDFSLSKRGSGDLVGILYSDLADKNPSLKALEASIDSLPEEKSDSLTDFYVFNNKNQQYYTSAKTYLNQIQDSVLREKITAAINKSLTAYDNTISEHTSLIKLLDSKVLSLDDLHNVLKLTVTLPVIEAYQKNNIPSKKPIEKVNKDFDKVIQEVNTQIK